MTTDSSNGPPDIDWEAAVFSTKSGPLDWAEDGLSPNNSGAMEFSSLGDSLAESNKPSSTSSGTTNSGTQRLDMAPRQQTHGRRANTTSRPTAATRDGRQDGAATASDGNKQPQQQRQRSHTTAAWTEPLDQHQHLQGERGATNLPRGRRQPQGLGISPRTHHLQKNLSSTGQPSRRCVSHSRGSAQLAKSISIAGSANAQHSPSWLSPTAASNQRKHVSRADAVDRWKHDKFDPDDSPSRGRPAGRNTTSNKGSSGRNRSATVTKTHQPLTTRPSAIVTHSRAKLGLDTAAMQSLSQFMSSTGISTPTGSFTRTNRAVSMNGVPRRDILEMEQSSSRGPAHHRDTKHKPLPSTNSAAQQRQKGRISEQAAKGRSFDPSLNTFRSTPDEDSASKAEPSASREQIPPTLLRAGQWAHPPQSAAGDSVLINRATANPGKASNGGKGTTQGHAKQGDMHIQLLSATSAKLAPKLSPGASEAADVAQRKPLSPIAASSLRSPTLGSPPDVGSQAIRRHSVATRVLTTIEQLSMQMQASREARISYTGNQREGCDYIDVKAGRQGTGNAAALVPNKSYEGTAGDTAKEVAADDRETQKQQQQLEWKLEWEEFCRGGGLERPLDELSDENLYKQDRDSRARSDSDHESEDTRHCADYMVGSPTPPLLYPVHDGNVSSSYNSSHSSTMATLVLENHTVPNHRPRSGGQLSIAEKAEVLCRLTPDANKDSLDEVERYNLSQRYQRPDDGIAMYDPIRGRYLFTVMIPVFSSKQEEAARTTALVPLAVYESDNVWAMVVEHRHEHRLAADTANRLAELIERQKSVALEIQSLMLSSAAEKAAMVAAATEETLNETGYDQMHYHHNYQQHTDYHYPSHHQHQQRH